MLKKEKLLFAVADHPTPKFSSGGGIVHAQ